MARRKKGRKGKAKKRRKRRTHARHFGDDPRIRHSRGEHTSYNPLEPWERAYRRKKQRSKLYLF